MQTGFFWYEMLRIEIQANQSYYQGFKEARINDCPKQFLWKSTSTSLG